jgi:hypothetical protein
MNDKERLAAALAVLEGYEKWEAAVIMNSNCWIHDCCIIALGMAEYDGMMELQARRNEVLGRFGRLLDGQRCEGRPE